MIPWWVYVLAGALLVGGPVVLVLLFAGAKKLNGPDIDQRDPYGLAGRDSDAPALDLDLAVARDAGVDVTPDGSHDHDDTLPPGVVAGELLWLYEQMPEAVALDQGDDLLAAPPVIPGRDETP